MTTNRRYPIFKILLIFIIISLPFYYIFAIKPLFSEYIMKNLEDNATRVAIHITSMLSKESDKNLSTLSLADNLNNNIQSFLKDFEITKMKIFSMDGEIIFSTNKQDIGKSYPDETFWGKIISGEVYSAIVEADSFSIDKEQFNQSFVETYIPIINNKQIVGVIEIYTNIERQRKSLDILSLKLNLMVISILLIMAAVFLIADEKEKKHLQARQKSQRRILKAKEEWEKTFDAIEDVIAIITLDLKIKRINKIGEKIFNTSFDKIIGRECYKVFCDSPEICPECPISKVIDEGKVHYCEQTNQQLGKIFRISVSPIFNEFGKVDAVVHVAHDITHERMMEQQMFSNQKMAALAVLTGGIAHNFRNILARILASSQLIEATYSNDQQLTEIAGWTVEAVHAGSKLVNGLIQFSQPLSKTEFQLIDLAQLIPDFHDFFRSGIPKNINMTYEVSQSIEVMGDHSTLFQVLTHICENAADAMPDGGDLSISISTMDNMAHIKIADSGIGMDKSILEKLFEPFFTTKEVDKGTGLGLSSSYGIIAEHDGDIKVESEKGTGTTFTIILPLVENIEGDDQLVSLQDIEGLGQKVLVVDDEEQALIPTVKLLEIAGYQASGATNCEEATVKSESWHPDMVILDYNMPGTNGIDCAVKLNHLNPHIKIIILSGSTIEELNKEVREREIDFICTCLAKPIDIKELSKVLENSIGKPAKKAAT